jgi:hypothetical protein
MRVIDNGGCGCAGFVVVADTRIKKELRADTRIKKNVVDVGAIKNPFLRIPIDIKEAQRIGAIRDRSHKRVRAEWANGRLSDNENYEWIGVTGELAFAQVFDGLKVDDSPQPNGDKGKDFVVPIYNKIDIKTAQKARRLLVVKNKVYADTYVQAYFNIKTNKVDLLGWTDREKVLLAPLGCFNKYNVISHWIWVTDLNPMADLKLRLR